ncbi:LysM peptidoglycan-binding domain-containing protein [Heyndrickxia acidiproducens]|uniref:LysM peptidoglycan-binding domain-containing protein n=1 Tax=Heyndrickxia acidiproducens TaxID=1121084 RepID=UPI00036A44CB|nr:LysM domain-containing protein [Heyndrickxia acidiproducens]
MKKIIAIFAALIMIYSVYYDIHVGTIPSASYAREIQPVSFENEIPAPEESIATVQVNPGDTVLTIVEKLSNTSSNLSIEKVIQDFSRLNNGITPEDIQIGQTYRFPIYHSSNQN